MENVPTIEESALKSLSGSTPAIFEYLPYLLQDLWEMGSAFAPIAGFIEKNKLNEEFDRLKILDLGCGKGGVSIPLAKQFNAEVTGVDAMPEFIETANLKAGEWKVEDKCAFITGDIRKKIDFNNSFNIVLLASVGPVIGNIKDTIDLLETYVAPGGYIILDEAYLPNNVKNGPAEIPEKDQFYNLISQSNFLVADEYIHSLADNEKINQQIFTKIQQRANELMELHPDKRNIFEEYLQSQQSENEMLESEIITLLVLLKHK